MNFLGVQGELPFMSRITEKQPSALSGLAKYLRRAGKRTTKTSSPNEQYHFDGSCKHFANPDARYLLPVGSSGLI